MDLVEQRRQSLDFVDDHPILCLQIRQLAPEEPRIDQVRLVNVLAQQIDPASVREMIPRPAGLPDTTHAEEEKAC
jgi:hypothetical protein